MIPRLKEFPASEVVENPATATIIPTIQTTSPPRSFRFASRITSWRSAILAASDKSDPHLWIMAGLKIKGFANSDLGILVVWFGTPTGEMFGELEKNASSPVSNALMVKLINVNNLSFYLPHFAILT